MGNAHCPYRANTFQKGASLTIWKGQYMYSYFFKFFCNISFTFNQLKMCTFISLLEPSEVLTLVILGSRALARVGIGKHARRNLIWESNPLLIFSIWYLPPQECIHFLSTFCELDFAQKLKRCYFGYFHFLPQIIPSSVPVLSNVFIFSCFKESYYLLLLERMVVKQIVPKAAFPHTASHTGKSLEREKLNKLNQERIE